jgi:hypothetical protein
MLMCMRKEYFDAFVTYNEHFSIITDNPDSRSHNQYLPHHLPCYFTLRKYCITPTIHHNTAIILAQERYVIKQKKEWTHTKKLLRKASGGDTQIRC